MGCGLIDFTGVLGELVSSSLIDHINDGSSLTSSAALTYPLMK